MKNLNLSSNQIVGNFNYSILLLMFLFLTGKSNGQCLVSGSNPNYSLPVDCDKFFDELLAKVYPEGVVYLNFHFIQNTSGGGHFGPTGDNNSISNDDNLSGITIAHDILDKLNEAISEGIIPAPNYQYNGQDVPSVVKLPWRFEIYSEVENEEDLYGGIWFWEDDNYEENLLLTEEQNGLVSYGNYDPYGNKALDIYFVEFNGAALDLTGDTGGAGDGINLFNSWKNYNHRMASNLSSNHVYQGTVLNHEIGHVMTGWNHVDDPTYPCPDAHSGIGNNSTNNVMHSWAVPGQLAWTPCQVNKMYENFLNSPSKLYYVPKDPCETNSSESYVVEENTNIVFSTPIIFDKNIIVENGASLTIECDLKMPPESKIKVKPGGSLLLNGATIANGCEDAQWFGIQVFGNKQGQNGNLQGHFVSTPNSMISNASVALSNPDIASFNFEYPSNGGHGRFDIEGTTFLNNSISLALYPCVYSVLSGNLILPYPATIEACDFITDANYLSTALSSATQMLLMGVNGPTIKSSKFINEKTSVTHLNHLGTGIFSFGSGFNLNSLTSNPSDRSLFTGYQYGVTAIAGFNEFTYNIQRTTFKENVVGITSIGVDKFKIQRCTLEVGGLDLPYNIDNNDFHEGISVLTGSLFTIHNNHFLGADNTPIPPDLPGEFFDPDKIGLRILNSGEASTKVKSNSFSDLFIANKAEGINRSPLQGSVGLSYECNQNSNFDYDFIIQKINPEDGILANQGSKSDAAKNTFTQLPDLWGSDFINGTDWLIQYWYSDDIPSHEPLHYFSNTNFVKRDDGDYGIDCVILPLQDVDVDSVESAFNQNDNLFDSLYTLRQNLIDGGVTSTWISVLNGTTVGTKSSFLTHLSNISPYTSITLLDAILGKTSLFTISEITSILQQNAHFYTNPDLRTKANTLWSISESSMASIFSNNNNNLLRLDSKISQAASNRAEALSEILNYYASDTLDRSAISYWLDQVENVELSFMKVDQAMARGDYQEAVDELGYIDVNYDWNERTEDVHAEYEDWYMLGRNMAGEYSDLNTWIEENETELVQLANNTISKPAGNARGLLRLYDPEYDFYWPPLSVETEIEPRTTEISSSNDLKNEVNVFPNPAANNVWFEYLVKANERVQLNISDLRGSIVLSFDLNSVPKHIVDISSLDSGVYYGSLVSSREKSTFRFVKAY